MSEKSPLLNERLLADLAALQKELEQMMPRVDRTRLRIQQQGNAVQQPVLVISGK